MNTQERCLICDSYENEVAWAPQVWRIARCLGCGVLFTLGRPSEEALVQRYGNGSLLGMHDVATFDLVRCPDWKRAEHRRILEMLSRLGVSSGTLLDVGCLWGFFLTNARQQGFEVVGLEPNAEAIRYVRDMLGFPGHQGSLRSASLTPRSFDVVTMLDVLEHLNDPIAELMEVFRISKPGGVLVVVTPNVDALMTRVVGLKRELFRQPWNPISDIPWHLWGFTPLTIARCVEKAGFEVELIKNLEPSVATTNRGAGSSLWKRVALRAVAEVSRALGSSDRMAVFARR